jgi:hypothetical protein
VLLWLLAGIGLLFVGLAVVRWAAAADPKTLLFAVKTAAFAVIGIAGGLLVLSGRGGWLFGLLPLLLPLVLRRSGWGGWGGTATLGGLGGVGKTPGQASQVRTRFFDMRLDHDTGELDGEVLEGPHAGRPLSELDVGDLVAMLPDVRAQDGKSGRLLEAYLDRRCPDWRSDRSAGEGSSDDSGKWRNDGAEPAGAMTAEDAYRVLGLSAGASAEEIKAAHQRLIRHLHPDRGGSSFLAAQVNRARDVLLGGARRR